MVKIIDTSHHKMYIDWDKVKATGVEGVILKATDGYFLPNSLEEINEPWTSHVDPSFTLYWNKLKDLFKWRGAYHFLRVDDEVAANAGRPNSQEQIFLFEETVKKEGLEWNDYVILDIEQAASQTDYLSKSAIGERVQTAIALTEQVFERKPIIYTGAWWWEMYHQYIDRNFIYQYPFWLSHYWNISNNDFVYNGSYYLEKPNRVFPVNWRGDDKLTKRLAYCRLPYTTISTINPDKVLLWQYSASGRIGGITSNVDINIEVIPETLWEEARGEEPDTTEPPVDPPEPPVECEGILNAILKALKALVVLIEDFCKKQ